MQNANVSEVARLKQQIEEEYEAGKSAMHGLLQGSATHGFITKKMEKMCADIAELVAIAGEEAMIEALRDLFYPLEEAC